MRRAIRTIRNNEQANGVAERWIGLTKVRATALLASKTMPPYLWTYATRWVCHAHNLSQLRMEPRKLPGFGDVVNVSVTNGVKPTFKPRGDIGVCLGHSNSIANGVVVLIVKQGQITELVTAKVRRLALDRNKSWTLSPSPHGGPAVFVNQDGEIRWSTTTIDVPTVEVLHPSKRYDHPATENLKHTFEGWAWYSSNIGDILPPWNEIGFAPGKDSIPDRPLDPLPQFHKSMPNLRIVDDDVPSYNPSLRG